MPNIIKEHDLDFHIRVLYNGNSFQLFALAEDVRFELSNGDVVIAPFGFRFDGRSSPGFLKGQFETFGKGATAWLLHDLLYVMDYGVVQHGWSMKKARKFADDEMYSLLKKVNPSQTVKNYLSYKAVRMFGKKVFEQSRDLMDKISIING